MAKVTKTAIQKMLSELKFDPADPKFRFSIDSNNSDYIKFRAQELLREGNLTDAARYIVLAKIMEANGT